MSEENTDLSLSAELGAAFEAEPAPAPEPSPEPAHEPQPEPAPQPIADGDPAPEPQPELEALEAPANWADNHRELFGTQSREAQEFLLERHKAMEGDYTRKMQAMAPLKDYEQVHQMFAPHMDQMKQNGVTPVGLIQEWGRVAQSLQSNPAEALRMLAAQHNINLSELAEQPPIDPQFAQLQSEVYNLRNQLSTRDAAEVQDRQSNVMNTIEQFASEQTETGDPANPYFDEVVDDMVALARAEMAAGKQPDIKDLYDKAVYANPSTRAKVLEAQQKAEEAKRAEEARRKAAEAQKASKSVSSSPSGQSPTAEMSLRDQLSSQF